MLEKERDSVEVEVQGDTWTVERVMLPALKYTRGQEGSEDFLSWISQSDQEPTTPAELTAGIERELQDGWSDPSQS